MGMDFHNLKNSHTYTTRNADTSWINTIKKLVPIKQLTSALDIGCGGGIYSKALADLGVTSVTAVDYSEAILAGARENCKDYHNISFKKGNALQTGLESNHFDFLLERALIHHLDDLSGCFEEAYRLLKNNGYLIIQDRTPEDCLLKGDASHIRGYFFEQFPKLIEKETNRRHQIKKVREMLRDSGFREIQEFKLWETRKVYAHKTKLLEDLRDRTGRSILHELNDIELESLINFIDGQIPNENTIVEKDRWTIWKAVK
ncbi:class I SAM-dependent methyltransferase [Robertmurraya yapensis]|uniref:Class I SAM-dependent methyltransferase n=2 Tax=Bacillaceae TaxID=186817 RepID=A0A431WJZ4_9BACI|nr:class I SAM-dependent methyltransferase [Bacillus yapensis]RTR35790.1 class I SAM-dependent methyltransferase [Bacillus yapensis]TKS98592.1 methyltransferase domain-containing protein [Bacillus yapensis]